MSFLDTSPAPIQRPDRGTSWSRFRVTDPFAREALLREICRTDAPLTLGAAGGRAIPAVLWAVDTAAACLRFSVADPSDLHRWLRTPALWATCYLREAKLQFELQGLSLSDSGTQRMLQAELPQFMVQLSRRKSLRVRRSTDEAPLARLAHPQEPTLQLMMPVVDISMSGCALWQHPGALPMAPGLQIAAVEVHLDEEGVLRTGLRVQHVSGGGGTRRPGVRVGCEWQGLSREHAEKLQRWITRGRRRRDMLSLSLD